MSFLRNCHCRIQIFHTVSQAGIHDKLSPKPKTSPLSPASSPSPKHRHSCAGRNPYKLSPIHVNTKDWVVCGCSSSVDSCLRRNDISKHWVVCGCSSSVDSCLPTPPNCKQFGEAPFAGMTACEHWVILGKLYRILATFLEIGVIQ